MFRYIYLRKKFNCKLTLESQLSPLFCNTKVNCNLCCQTQNFKMPTNHELTLFEVKIYFLVSSKFPQCIMHKLSPQQQSEIYHNFLKAKYKILKRSLNDMIPTF